MNHLSRAHHIDLAAPPAEVFPLFTPAGEKLWIREWDPRYLHPASGETRQGMVFTTGAGDAFLEQFGEAAFRTMLEGWKSGIEAWLRRQA